MPNNFKYIAFIIFVLLLLFQGCSTKEEFSISSIQSETSTKNTNKNLIANIFIDASKDMLGYFNPGEFRKELGRLKNTLHQDNNIIAIEHFLITKDKDIKKLNKIEYEAFITEGKIPKKTGNTTIESTLKEIETYLCDTCITILVSDLKLSLYNRDKKELIGKVDINDLEIISNKIENILIGFNNKKISSSIYGLKADYDGRYDTYKFYEFFTSQDIFEQEISYYLDGTPIYRQRKIGEKKEKQLRKSSIWNCCKEKRPFYIWMFGHPSNVTNLNQKLLKDKNFDSNYNLNLGLNSYSDANYVFLNRPRTGQFSINKKDACKSLKYVQLNDEINFTLGLDLSAYEENDTIMLSYLQDNIKAQSDNIDINISEILTTNQYKSNYNPTKIDKKNIKNMTHIVSLSISNLIDNTATFSIFLPKEKNNWFKDWHTNDDTKETKMKGKTFGFKYLINSIERAYQDEDTNYFNITFEIK